LTKFTQVIEHKIISNWIKNEASVLDLGCGDGELLSRLIKQKSVHAQGIELSEQAAHNCIASGLSVFQQDIDTGLTEYADKSVDYVILNQTLQQVKKPDFAIRALRVGKKSS
jgi:methionine biosynthesis protein MetW